jgi:hypothetical protein
MHTRIRRGRKHYDTEVAFTYLGRCSIGQFEQHTKMLRAEADAAKDNADAAEKAQAAEELLEWLLERMGGDRNAVVLDVIRAIGDTPG